MLQALKQLTTHLMGGNEVAAAPITGIAAIQATLRSVPFLATRVRPRQERVELADCALGGG